MVTNKKNLDAAFATFREDELNFIKSVFDIYIINPDRNQDSIFKDPFFWGKVADIAEHNNNSKNNDRQKFRFIDRPPDASYKIDSERYNLELQEVMSYIRSDPDSYINIKKICEAQELALEKEKLLHRSVAENEMGKDIIIILGRKYRLNQEGGHRPIYSMDTIEEFYIKAIAISILAETDGDSIAAKEILDNGGMEIIKNLDERSAVELLMDLQVITPNEEEINSNISEEQEIKSNIRNENEGKSR